MEGSVCGTPQPGLQVSMRGDSVTGSPHPQLLACCSNLSHQPYLRVRWGLSEDVGFPPRGDSGHPVSDPELGRAGGPCGPGGGAGTVSPAGGPAAAAVSEWPRAPDTLPAASQPLATPGGTRSSFGRQLR